MIRFTVVAGREAGRSVVVSGFPMSIGREAGCHLRLEDAGVWESHATVHMIDGVGLVLRSRPETTVDVNGAAVSEQRLRNGDLLTLGASKVRFGFSETRQHSFMGREWATWAGVAALCGAQLVLIYFLLG